MRLDTARLRLVASTLALCRAEADRAALGRALGACVPDGWPPPGMAAAVTAWTQALAAAPELAGWLGWYWLRVAPPQVDLLIGYGGFKGAPDARGVVELGYALVEGYQGHGYGSEAVRALVAWAARDDRLWRIEADTSPALVTSAALLGRLGFRRLPEVDPQVARYGLECRRSSTISLREVAKIRNAPGRR